MIQAETMLNEGTYNPKFMDIGSPGSGKTTSLTTFPLSWNVLVLDMFGNKESLEGCPNVEVASYSDLDPTSPHSWIQLEKDRKDLVSMLERDTFKWNVLAIDTITGLVRFCENYLLVVHPESRGIGVTVDTQLRPRVISTVLPEAFCLFFPF